MLFPIRCFTCGKPLKNYETFEKKMKIECKNFQKKSDKVFVYPNHQKLLETYADTSLDKMGYHHECCRRMYISHPIGLERTMEMYDNEPLSIEDLENL